ncbi:hypothetical protein Hanom_Chr12g01095611 [Helianthus anomalus]
MLHELNFFLLWLVTILINTNALILLSKININHKVNHGQNGNKEIKPIHMTVV